MGSEKYRSSKVAPPSFHVLEEMFLVSIEGRKSPHLKDCYMDQQTVAQTPWPRTKWDCQYLTECPSESEVAQSCLILCNPMHCSLPGSSVHGIFQARVLEWVAISFSRGSFQPRDWTRVSRTAGRCFITWTTGDAQGGEHRWMGLDDTCPRKFLVTALMGSNSLLTSEAMTLLKFPELNEPPGRRTSKGKQLSGP